MVAYLRLAMIIWLNGAFGIGKTTVARMLAKRLPGAIVYDPELVGMALQRMTRRVDDFQDLRAWRRLTIAGVRLMRRLRPIVIVPMAISNPAYLEELRRGIDARWFCLVAPEEVVHARLRDRGGDAEWSYRRASECCVAHRNACFGEHIDATRTPEEIVDRLLAALTA